MSAQVILTQPSLASPRAIVLVTTALTYGGAEQQVVLLARGLAQRGWAVRVVSLRPPEAHLAALAEAGVGVASLQMGRRFPDPRGLVRLVRLLKDWAPDIVHGHMVHANLLSRVARLFVRFPVLISTAHNIVEGPRWLEVAYRLTEPLCDAVTNVSAAAVDRYIRVGAASAAKIRLIPNGVDLSRFRPDLAARARLRRELGVDDRSVLLSVARFEPQKDHANLLAAMRLIVDLRPDVMLFLVGQGSLEQEIRLKAEALGLSNHVQFLGTRSDIPAVMNASDVYVMSSLWEGLPLVLIEAASVGLPIVATDVGGNSEVVLPSASGILVRPADPGAIAEAALSVLGVPRAEREQWSATGRAVVEDEYSLEGVLDRWETLYRELWGRKAVGAHPQRDDKEPPKKDLLFSEWDIPI